MGDENTENPPGIFRYKSIDPLIHGKLRLVILSLLRSQGPLEFTAVKSTVNATWGNLASNVNQLEQAGLLEKFSRIVDDRTVVALRLTPLGASKLSEYLRHMRELLVATGAKIPKAQ